jgi:hypothetical protein
MREAVLLAFCESWPEQTSKLRQLSTSEWQKLLHWLDISGLALYFLDRLIELQRCDTLPFEVLARLQQNLIDNTKRTLDMVAESTSIQRKFQEAGLSYAILKGFSLWPNSVPKLELRSQLDLDFLVAERSMPEARRILEDKGYCLRAISGRSWEFKTNHIPSGSLKDLYKVVPSRTVELHVESSKEGSSPLLERVERRQFDGISVPMLSPVDLLLGQGLHLCKHVCSEFSRTAHLLEFRCHVLAHRYDDDFWAKLQSTVAGDPRSSLSLGIAISLITRVMDDFAPEELTRWTVRNMPPSARLWVEMYGVRAALGNFPGNKLYLLLQRELETAGIRTKRSLRRALVPLKFPPPILHAPVDETRRASVHRYRMQFRFILFRTRFHIMEGLRYMCESFRWRYRMKGLTANCKAQPVYSDTRSLEL